MIRSGCFSLLLLCASAAFGQTWDWKAEGLQKDQLAEMRLFIPEDLPAVRGVLVLSPGYAGDGRGMAADKEWQDFARRNRFALLGCRFLGSEGGFYWDRSWSQQALIKGLNELAQISGHAELAKAPWLLWGHSAGGCLSYLVARYQPRRTIAFVLNKSGGGLDKGPSAEGLKVPAIFFVGQNDTETRFYSLTGFYQAHRRNGSPWALVVEPGEGHGIGASKKMALTFFEEILALRLDEKGKLKEIDAGAGWVGDIADHEIEPVTESSGIPSETSWFPGEKSARQWAELFQKKNPGGETGPAMETP